MVAQYTSVHSTSTTNYKLRFSYKLDSQLNSPNQQRDSPTISKLPSPDPVS